jgi:hypothetical protein
MGDTTIHLRPPGQKWQVLGRETFRGILPSNVRVEADPGGFATCSFDLPRDPFVPHIDLSAFTPCVIEDGAHELFRGKVMETPARGEPDLSIAVQGRGLQYALDENPVEYAWCHSDMSEWRDMRAAPNVDLTQVRAEGQAVEVGSGGKITIGQATGSPYFAGKSQGVFLDLGPNRRARRIDLNWDSLNLAGNSAFAVIVRGRDTADAWNYMSTGQLAGQPVGEPDSSLRASYSDAITMYGNPDTAGQGQIGFEDASTWGFFSPPARLIGIFLYWITGTGALTGSDHLFILNSIRVYGDNRHYGRYRANLTASDVVKDAVERASVGITVPEQSPLPTTLYKDELYQASWSDKLLPGVQTTHNASYYRLRTPPGRLVPEYTPDGALTPNLVQSGRSPAYFDTGGPLLDGDPGGSAYASFDGLLAGGAQYFGMSNFPSRNPYGHIGFAIVVWFRTSTLGIVTGDPFAQPNRIVCNDRSDLSLPPASSWHFAVVIDNTGRVVLGAKAPANSMSMTRAAPSNASPNYADGQWHMLFIRRSRSSADIDFTLDDRDAVFTYGRPWGNSAANSYYVAPTSWRLDPTPGIYFGTRHGGDKSFNGDLAEIAVFWGDVPIEWAKHLYRAGRRNIDTPFKRTLLRVPGLATTEPRTARAVNESVNTNHRWITKVGRGGALEFGPQRTVPKYALTAAAARRFNQTALSAGEESYNACVVAGQSASGVPVSVQRIAAQQPGTTWADPDTAFIPNPTFDDTVPGLPYPGDNDTWQYLGDTTSGPPRDGSLAMDTVTFRSAPQSLKIDARGQTDARSGVSHWFERQGSMLRRGRLYRLRWWARTAAYSSNALRAWLGVYSENAISAWGTRVATGDETWGAANTWEQYEITLIPPRDIDNATLFIWAADSHGFVSPGSGVTPKDFWVDDFELKVGVNGHLDRQNDLRTHTIVHNQPLTTEIGTAMADAFLQSHVRQQLRGSVDVGPGDVVLYDTGVPVPLGSLVADTNELLHIPSLVDPDTGAQGRDGKMVSVAYTPETEQASISIDNQVDNFAVFMSRHGLHSGNR